MSTYNESDYGYDHGEDELLLMENRQPRDRFVHWGIIASLVLSVFLFSCEPAHAQDGLATYYTSASCAGEAKAMRLKGSYWGNKTANGEAYDENALTCALPIKLKQGQSGKEYLVYSEKTDRSVVVRHNDFGPAAKPRKRGVVIDLTPRAFMEVCGDGGECQVSIQEIK